MIYLKNKQKNIRKWLLFFFHFHFSIWIKILLFQWNFAAISSFMTHYSLLCIAFLFFYLFMDVNYCRHQNENKSELVMRKEKNVSWFDGQSCILCCLFHAIEHLFCRMCNFWINIALNVFTSGLLNFNCLHKWPMNWYKSRRFIEQYRVFIV